MNAWLQTVAFDIKINENRFVKGMKSKRLATAAPHR